MLVDNSEEGLLFRCLAFVNVLYHTVRKIHLPPSLWVMFFII